MHYLLFYEADADYAEQRKPFRSAHLQHAREAVARGELVLGGALANPVDGAVLLFRGESPGAAERFASTDPYVVNGVVKRWHVREWTTVVGDAAEVAIPSHRQG
jgi:uncharacterized protein YciI